MSAPRTKPDLTTPHGRRRYFGCSDEVREWGAQVTADNRGVDHSVPGRRITPRTERTAMAVRAPGSTWHDCPRYGSRSPITNDNCCAAQLSIFDAMVTHNGSR